MKIYLINRKTILKMAVVLLVLGVSIIGTNEFNINIESVFNPNKELPIYYVDSKEKKVSISFDAAWGTEHTEAILDILDKYNVKTTFFLVDFWVTKHPDMVKEIDRRGHEVANHSTTHPKMSELSKEDMIKEIKTTEESIEKIIGKKTTLFRPPFGDYNDSLIQTSREINYHVIQWDVDSLDWKEMGAQPVVDRVTRNVKNGSIVLFHNNAKYVQEYLPLVIDKLQKDGYEIVPISELIYKENYRMESDGKQVQNKK
ncbi:polysaccharide deacetylase PdaB [Gottschalkia acidurici 9a]|uniref:Polysaccharide deacetylase PdaB n=1 Tax=Gottschalkia acidurici (strain ATCC 7906 / DSM 604 / BCRC 14475 / CIP 104303 / KCTC 5404 / NCIMB 10678 / 9a) TaxID=1128398 RepID=K0AZY3_GOTA9|nr:polysaccharide deacetylase family protein [Gottschalkia acidurici]AFS77906.1 polysaccharide deacetylase PdaB [Gottschalkia acidurici 9a]